MAWPVDWLLRTPWPGLLAWAALYCSDYVLTIVCARLYRTGVSDTIVLEGSYEITPFYQRDVDALRAVSPRFLVVLAASCGVVFLVWTASVSGYYSFILGALIGLQLVVHVRHYRNLFLFRTIARKNGIRGRIEYARHLMLVASSLEIATFAILFFVVFVFTGSAFVLGGAVASSCMAANHWTLARKHLPTTDQPARTEIAPGSLDPVTKHN
jgi:hypothetical protein